jgi:hypothetical protein
VEVRFPDEPARVGVECVDNPVVTVEEDQIALQGRRIGPFKFGAIEAAGEMPAEMASGKIEAEKVIALRDRVDRVAFSRNVRRDAEVTFASGGDKVFPAHVSRNPVECIDVTLFADVCANDDQIFGDERVAMEAGLIAVLMDVVAPAELAGVFVEGVEISGTGADEQ